MAKWRETLSNGGRKGKGKGKGLNQSGIRRKVQHDVRHEHISVYSFPLSAQSFSSLKLFCHVFEHFE